jgi:hypothetical protein
MKALLLLAVIPLAVAPHARVRRRHLNQIANPLHKKPRTQRKRLLIPTPDRTQMRRHRTQMQQLQTATLVNTEEAGESDDIEIPRKFAHWNEYQGPYFGIRAGAGL